MIGLVFNECTKPNISQDRGIEVLNFILCIRHCLVFWQFETLFVVVLKNSSTFIQQLILKRS